MMRWREAPVTICGTVKDMSGRLKEHLRSTAVLVGLQFTPRAAKDEHYTAIPGTLCVPLADR